MRAWKTRTVLGSLAVGLGAVACTSLLGDLPAATILGDDSGAVDATTPDVGPGVDGSHPDSATADVGTIDSAGDAPPPVDGGTDSADASDGAAADANPCDAGSAFCTTGCVSLDTNTNCGGCGLTCPTGCAASQCLVTLAQSIPNATGIAINGIKAYVTSDQVNGNIYSMSLSGGGPTNLTPNFPQAEPFGVAVDNANVYWTNYNGGGTNGSVMKMPIGGQVAPIVVAPNQTAPSMIVVDAQDQNLYWTNAGSPGSVQKYPLSNGTVTPLIGGINGPFGLAVDSTYAYVALTSDDYVIKVLLSNGTIAAQLTIPENNPYGLAIDGTNVYFTNNANTGDARQVAQDASMSAGIAFANTTLPAGIATDGVNVYWASNNAIYKSRVGVPSGGSVFVSNQSGASFVAVDATSVYWTNSKAGTVMKITPK
jgi:hypothetical protein